MKSMFIVFKMTAQITRTQQKRKKIEKMKGDRDFKENVSKIPQNVQMVKFFTVFSSFLGPLAIFSLFSFLFSSCDMCGHFEYNKPTFNDNFFSHEKHHLRGDLKNMFCQFSKKRWTFEIIFFGKSVIFLI